MVFLVWENGVFVLAVQRGCFSVWPATLFFALGLAREVGAKNAYGINAPVFSLGARGGAFLV